MRLETAFFILEHGSSEGEDKYLEAVETIKEKCMPVVRCKDCKHADKERRNITEKRYYDDILFCRNSDLCNDEPLAMWPNDFCSYGERKEAANES